MSTTSAAFLDSAASRRALLRAFVPVLAAASGLATLTAAADAAGANPGSSSGQGHGRGRRRRRDDRQDRESRRNRARRGNRPHRSPAPAPAPAPTPIPAPPPVFIIPFISARYSYDNTGTVTVEGTGFQPGVPVNLSITADWSFLLGSYLMDYTYELFPDAAGAFTLSIPGYCPQELDVVADQTGLPALTIHRSFGSYTCLLGS